MLRDLPQRVDPRSEVRERPGLEQPFAGNRVDAHSDFRDHSEDAFGPEEDADQVGTRGGTGRPPEVDVSCGSGRADARDHRVEATMARRVLS